VWNGNLLHELPLITTDVQSRLFKAALKKSIGDQVLAPLECQTLLFEAANLLNQRPIGRMLVVTGYLP
jgi:hypothetical protein